MKPKQIIRLASRDTTWWTDRAGRYGVNTALLTLAVSLSAWGQAARPSPAPEAVPWGISSSASSFRNHAEWFPKMSAAGISWVRLFPEWRSLQPARDTWSWDQPDTLVKNAAAHHIRINAVLMGSTPWAQTKAHAFPMSQLDAWSDWVTAVVSRYRNQIRHWEVWNEGNGGFNDDHHATADYAALVAATAAAARKADPQAQIGLTVASFDAPYLHQAALALAKAGHPNAFDFLCIHPYEVAEGIGQPDGEIPYLWMSGLLRGALKVSAPERTNAEIWITEAGRRIETRNGRTVTEEEAAKTLPKLYVMALAQGIRRVQWFEAQDPVGEDQGFGLLKRDGSPRAAYRAFKSMTDCLGASPRYLGWLALGSRGQGYGFVFQGASRPVLAAWLPGGEKDQSITFDTEVTAVSALSGIPSPLKASQALTLTDTPVFVTGVPANLVKQAQANAEKNFPWGGDFAAAKTVTVQLGTAEGNQGLFQVRPGLTPTVRFPDGSAGILVRGDQSTTYFAHPSFADLLTRDYHVRVTIRRIAPGNVGMNLFYEAADSQGRTPYKNRGIWFGASPSTDWQTHTWHITDASLSKMWGYDIEFRPEQSVPFVIGKVEVSTSAF